MISDWSFWDYISFSEAVFVLIMPLYYFFTTFDSVHLFAIFGIQVTNILVEFLKRNVFNDWIFFKRNPIPPLLIF